MTELVQGYKRTGIRGVFISGGVLVYLEENEIKNLFLDLVQEFAGAKWCFTADIKKWSNRIEIVDEFPFYQESIKRLPGREDFNTT